MQAETKKVRSYNPGTKDPMNNPATEIVLEAPNDFCRVENWYPVIKDITFETVWIDISLMAAEALLRKREKKMHLKKAREIGLEVEKIKEMEDFVSPEDKLILQKLESDIDEKIKVFVDSSGGAFVKLSTRSPKDAILNSEKIKKVISEQMTQLCHEGDTEEQWNIKAAISFIRGCCYGLKVTTASEALKFIEDSQRTYEDISLLKLLHGEEHFDMKFVIRKWEDFLPEWEFRAFVVNDELTAITQYYQLCFVPEISEKKEEISKAIKSYFDSIKHLIPITNYTIDFAVFPNLSKIWVIEINHPPPTAGTSLFNWDDPGDRKILAEGPFQLRILEKPLPSPLNDIHPPIKRFFKYLKAGKQETELKGFVHAGYSCDDCSILPIVGARYHCEQCVQSYDYCSICYDTKQHDPTHQFTKIEGPQTAPPSNTKEEKSTCTVQ